MTVLVTGGCGYIGAHVVHALHQAGEKVVVVDDLSYGKPTRIEGSRLYGMDIAAPGAGERLAEIMKAEGVDSVIHFAARKQVGESVEKPLWYYQQNLNGMLNVLIGMRDSGAKKLVFSSSAATYGVPPVDVVPEDVVPMLPINPYGQTKLFGEWMARACEEPYGIRFCGLRYFNVAGCGPVELEDPAILNLIPMLFDRLKKGKAPAIFGDDYPTPDGTCVRDYIHVVDLAKGHVKAVDLADAHIAALKYLDRDERKYDAFNVGTGEGTSVRQIVDEVKKVTGLPFKETVMGRRAGHLALQVGCAVGATAICLPERQLDFDTEIVERMRIGRIKGRNHHIIIVAEDYGSAQEVADQIHEATGIDTSVTILGHIQRGGSPSAMDRVMATRMGYAAVRALMEGKTNRVVVSDNNIVTDIDIEEGLAQSKDLNQCLFEAQQTVAI